ncbi:PAS domain S-box protein [Ferruginibacter lapsinanis]|uniref:PAS domain-containing sensor histidine kinase n=1 Tax=Ferruginibacter lapsinanis TaxID=563172 RepID=UPI001E507EE8|nr:PAS domain S-box protein [Ferruginibacter lapsinanis]UEG50281.1 PAS domain S-box protein [Ferruginibacter lapsinanis]
MTNLAAKLVNASESKLSVIYKSSFRISDLLNSVPEAIITTDTHFNITGLNPVAEQIYGSPLNEAVGQPLFDFIRFEFIGSTTREEAISHLQKHEFWSGDIIYYTSTNQKVFFNTRCTLIKDDTGKVSGIVIVNSNITEKVIQRKNLDLAEKKYETVVESLSDGVMMIGADGRIATANKRAIEILGLTEDEINGKVIACPSWKTIKQDGSPFPINEFPAIVTLETGIEQNNVIMGIAKPDGNIVWISINSRGIFKEGATKPNAVVASFEDITNIIEANKKLQQSEILFSSFINNSQTANWIYDEDGYVVVANNEYNKISNFPENAIGKHITEIFPNEYGKQLIERNKNFFETGKPAIFESTLPQADGSHRSFLSYLFLITIPGNKRLIGGQAIDITEQKNALQKLQDSEVLFRGFMTNSQNLGWVYDEDGNFVYGNPLLMETLGIDEEALGRNITTLPYLGIAKQILIKNKKVLATGEAIISEDKLIDKHGNVKHFIAHYFLLPFGNKKRFVGGHALDITERKKIESELLNEQIQKQKQINQATIEAQEKERNRISEELHDNVNQLLMSSKLHIGAAKKNQGNQDELLSKATEYLMMAVDEIRSLSKSLSTKVVSVVGLEKGIADIAENLEKLNNITVETDISEAVIDKLSTEQKLMVFRIVQEQTNNIIKYSGASKTSISIHEKNGKCQLSIVDNGKGFDKKTQKSKGIGLINIFNRADAYNGKVDIETSPGNGCAITISFPFLYF